MIKSIFLVLLAVSSGIVVGNGIGAFVTLLNIVPRLAQLTSTGRHLKKYKLSLVLGMFIYSIIYFYDISFKLNEYACIILGTFYGMFVGIFASALAETLNVLPVLSKKFDVYDYLAYIALAIAMGKVTGSLFNWLEFVKVK